MSAENFDRALGFILGAEGGYSDGRGKNRADRGGATNRGITQKTYDSWRIRRGLGQSPVKFCGDDEARAIYHDDYWRAVRGDDLLWPLDLVAFDTAVQHGPKTAAEYIQRAAGKLKIDGAIGPLTLARLAECDPQDIAELVIIQREALYEQIIEEDPTQIVFEHGWMNRLQRLGATINAEITGG